MIKTAMHQAQRFFVVLLQMLGVEEIIEKPVFIKLIVVKCIKTVIATKS